MSTVTQHPGSVQWDLVELVPPELDEVIELRSFAVPGRPGASVLLTEQPRWWESARPEASARYAVRAVVDGREAAVAAFDALGDADLFARVQAEYLEQHGSLFPDGYADEAPELPESAYHATAEDSTWWARHAHEQESELDAWLERGAPDDYMG